MGMFDYIRVDHRVVPAWDSTISKKVYDAEVAEIISKEGGQEYELSCTFDCYEITHDGFLIRTTEHWRNEDDWRVSPEKRAELARALPVEGRPGCWHVADYSGTLRPACLTGRIKFEISKGRLVRSGFWDLYPSATPDIVPARQRRRERAERLATRFGKQSRAGKKWARVHKKLSAKRTKRIGFVMRDEMSSHSNPALTEAMVSTIRLMRQHGSQLTEVMQSANLSLGQLTSDDRLVAKRLNFIPRLAANLNI